MHFGDQYRGIPRTTASIYIMENRYNADRLLEGYYGCLGLIHDKGQFTVPADLLRNASTRQESLWLPWK